MVGDNPIQTMRKALEILRDCFKLIAVGDLVCYTMIENDKIPDICVIDGKTKRKYETPKIKEEGFSMVLKAWNPPGHITQEVLKTIKEATEALNKKHKVLIKIYGEEDLLALPLITQSPENSCVVIGIPNVGVGYVRIDKETKKAVEEILAKFLEVDITPDEIS